MPDDNYHDGGALRNPKNESKRRTPAEREAMINAVKEERLKGQLDRIRRERQHKSVEIRRELDKKFDAELEKEVRKRLAVGPALAPKPQGVFAGKVFKETPVRTKQQYEEIKRSLRPVVREKHERLVQEKLKSFNQELDRILDAAYAPGRSPAAEKFNATTKQQEVGERHQAARQVAIDRALGRNSENRKQSSGPEQNAELTREFNRPRR